ncbi:unnamed protein product [Rhizoctonia solani]|uniref:Uncharacterized protein n=1 Tax=Rhizoctonia solani TaxID=456999 RepID=A0A8H3DDG4_9AGAM|nr:unnamed protein product [Rhizoctonia solani]
MGRPEPFVYTPRVASTMRSAVTTLFTFVAPPAIPLGSVLDRLIGSVLEIVDVSHKSRREELRDFGGYVGRVVNQLVSALRNEQLSRQVNVRENLEELQKTLDKILCNMRYINSSNSFMARLRRALFPEEDQMQVFRMRQQLEDALRVFHFAAACELLVRPQNLSRDQLADAPMPTQQDTRNSPSEPVYDRSECQEHADLHTSELAQAGLSLLSPGLNQVHCQDSLQRPRTRARRGAFIATAPPKLESDELTKVYLEVNELRQSFYRSRRPLPAMQLAVALGSYSGLLAGSGLAAEALTASQESAKLFKAVAEKGPEVHFDSD